MASIIPFFNRSSPEKDLEIHEMNKDAINDRFDGRIEMASNAWERAEGDYDRLKGSLNFREPLYWRAPYAQLYWVLLLALAVAEVPLNRLGFQLFFLESPTISTVVAAVVGAGLIGLAHGLGTMARRLRHTCEESVWGYISLVWIAVILTAIVATCYGLGILRQEFLTFLAQPAPSFADAVRNQSYTEIATIVMNAEMTLVGAIFVFFNLVLIVLGVLLAFFRHDPHPSYEQLDRDRKEAEQSHKSLTEQKTDKIVEEENRFILLCERKGKDWAHVRPQGRVANS